eukprot:TRINITY_DN8239_c0_g1_i1.p1 TRINITY_DN8239_c0_g1~~TRINITY_DN8239_c0_g1_i1.p1  ORF type:complete len:229 (-),score=39.08 TRINITY_DN8239_c0_g1_i1:302-988(-)
MSFGKPTLINMAWRIDHRRAIFSQHNEWLSNLFKILSRPNTVIASQSVYDVEYLYYFTGLNATLLEPFSYYASNFTYKIEQKRKYLIGPMRAKDIGMSGPGYEILWAMREYENKVGREIDFTAKYMRDEFPAAYTFEKLATYPAIICLPYAAWSLAFNDYYALGMPMLFPSIKFLSKLHRTDVWKLIEFTTTSNYYDDAPMEDEPKRQFWKGKRHPYDPESILTVGGL